jgi:hypothetical protein
VQAIEVHTLMIGGGAVRRALTVIAIGLVVGLGFGLRSTHPSLADPPLEAARNRALMQAWVRADDALASLASVLADAIEHARNGTAMTVAGDRPPAPELSAAADALAGGAGQADAGHRAIQALAEMALAIAPGAHIPSLSLTGPDLLLIASGLRSSADAATLFVERRDATGTIVGGLRDALEALKGNLPAAAIVSLDRTMAPFALLRAWAPRPGLLDYWMQVTGELIAAARDIAEATIARDPAAQKAAGERYAKAGEAARGADNALAVTLSEEGAAVSATPLQRLAAAAATVDQERGAIQPLTVPRS